MRETDVVFEGHAGNQLAGRLGLPAGAPRACAVFAHCFACQGDVRAATYVSRALVDRGFAVLRFDFTGLGDSEGDLADTTFTSNVGDVVAAADFLRREHSAPALLVGHSLGGAAVLAAASRIPESRAVVTIAAPAEPLHLRDFLEEAAGGLAADGSATVHLAGRTIRASKALLDDLRESVLAPKIHDLGRALLVMHAPLDAVVGIDNARAIYDAAMHPKSFISLDGADHLLRDRDDARYAADVIAAWSARYISPPTTTEGQPTPPPEAAEDASDTGAVVVSAGPTGYDNQVAVRRHRLVADEPIAVGGTDLGPTPYDLLLASLGACTSMTLRMYADRKGWPLEGVTVRLTHGRVHARDCADCQTKDGKIDVIERHVRVEGPLDDAQRARLLEIADKCPVHRTLHSEIKVRSHIE